MKAFDARCSACDGLHIVWVAFTHEPGDTVKIAHTRCSNACGAYCKHDLENELSGLDHKDKWGPESANQQPMVQ